jgi:hypothetical protein
MKILEKLKGLLEGEEPLIAELVLIGIALSFYYITKKLSPMGWYFISIPLIILGLLILLLIYKIINLIKKRVSKK